ncbi:tetratricopeptide repeat protein [Streptodolium elevatio]
MREHGQGQDRSQHSGGLARCLQITGYRPYHQPDGNYRAAERDCPPRRTLPSCHSAIMPLATTLRAGSRVLKGQRCLVGDACLTSRRKVVDELGFWRRSKPAASSARRGNGISARDRSVALGGDGQHISTGDYAVHQEINAELMLTLPPEAFRPVAEVDVPAQLSNLRPGYFVGRDDGLGEIDRAMRVSGERVVHAVYGLGGIGKSALAAHWASTRALCRVRVRWWIPAASEASLNTGLAGLAAALQPELAMLPTGILRERAIQWLGTHDDWLLVLDNVEDVAVVRALVGRTGGGSVLITSRRALGWHGTSSTQRLDAPAELDAAELFTAILNQHGRRDSQGADEVCAALGRLPLAVKQAASYCAATGTDPLQYLELLAQWPAEMFAASADGDAERTIARVWRITLNRLAENPDATVVLRILSWFAPEGIPRALLDRGSPDPALITAIGQLAAHSMIAQDLESLSVHPLVQAVARTPDLGDPHRQPGDIESARELATMCVEAAIPRDSHDPQLWPLWRKLLPHAEALIERADPATDTEYTAALLGRVGNYLHDQGAGKLAVERLTRAVDIMHRALPDSPYTLTFENSLAAAHVTAGNVAVGIALHQHTLTAQYQRNDDAAPAVLNSLNNLASALLAAHRFYEALPMFQEVLRVRKDSLPEDDPATLNSRNNLARTLSAVGEHDEAIRLFEVNLAARTRVHGPTHRMTFEALHNLGAALAESGENERALPLLEHAHQELGQLSEHHPDTLAAGNTLARCLLEIDPDRATALHEEILTSALTAHGPSHPLTVLFRHNLGCAYASNGHPSAALKQWETAYADAAETFSSDHPLMMTLTHHLTDARRNQNDKNS